MKEEENEVKEGRRSSESSKSITPDASAIGIRPKPVIRKPENVNIGCKSEPIETKWHWAPGAWQDATRTSAFQPYKVSCFPLTFAIRMYVFHATSVLYLSEVDYLSYLASVYLFAATNFTHQLAKRQHTNPNTSALCRK